MIAKDLKIINANQEYVIKSKSFECSKVKVDQTVIIYIMNERNEPLAGGIISLFEEFGFLEPYHM